MPRQTLTTDVTTETTVTLSPKLLTAIKKMLTKYRERVAERKVLEVAIEKDKGALELAFADADEYAAIEAGAKVKTPFGIVSLKVIKDDGKNEDGSAKMGKLDEVALMKKFKLSMADLDSCRSAYTPKKAYLGVYLPKE